MTDLASPITSPISQVDGTTRKAIAVALLCSGALVSLMPAAAYAQTLPVEIPEDEMTDLGTLGGDYSFAEGVSDDGGVVVGAARPESGGNNQAFRWTSAMGMEPLGTLGGSYSYARGVSGDGSTVFGYSYLDDNNYNHAFRWTETEGMVALGTLGGNYSYAYASSVDGSVIVGQASINSVNNQYRAFIWTQADGMVSLGTLGGDYSYAYDVSGDGTVVVGLSHLMTNSASRAFRWTQSDGMQDLGTLGGTHSYARAVSRDGSAITGYADNSAEQDRAFRWTQAGGLQDLGTLGGDYSHGRAISNDGSAITGSSRTATNDENHAFLWTEAGGMQDLGTLGGDYSYGEDISGDGSVVVGYSRTAPSMTGEDSGESHAFRWTQEDGIVDLGTLGGNYSYAYDVSDDGTTIVGESRNADGFYRAFIYRTQMQDFTNMIASFPLAVSDMQASGEAQRQTLSQLLDRACDVGLDNKLCLGVDGLLEFASASTQPRLAKRKDNAIQISAGVRLSPEITAGAGIGFYKNKDDFFSVQPDSGVSYGGWLSYAPGGVGGVGPRARIAFGMADQSNDILRGQGLDNVMVTPGRTDMTTSTLSTTFGYGVQAGSVVVAPLMGLTWEHTKLDGFAEAAGDFPATFDGDSFDAVYASVGGEVAAPLASGLTLTVTALADIDLDSDDWVMTGMTTIPGLENFAVQSEFDRKEVRGRFGVELAKQIGAATFSINGALRTSTIDGNSSASVGAGVTLGF